MNMKKALIGILIFAIAAMCAVPVFAQRYEFGLTWNWCDPAMDGSYASRYAPPYLSGGPYSSLAEQTVRIKAKAISGLAGFFTWFPVSNIGVQFVAEFFKPDFGGANSPYAYSLTYERPMPDHTTRTVSYANSMDWGQTEGDVREIVLSLNGVLRLPLTRSLSVNISGGPSYFYFEGKAGYIGYTKFWTSADGLLHIQNFKLPYEFGPQNRLGFNVGGEAAFHLSGTISLIGEYRYFACAKAKTSLHLTPSDVLPDTVADLESELGLGSMKLDPSFTRFSAGIKFRF
jgi:opacity protein-like surface antigen